MLIARNNMFVVFKGELEKVACMLNMGSAGSYASLSFVRRYGPFPNLIAREITQ